MCYLEKKRRSGRKELKARWTSGRRSDLVARIWRGASQVAEKHRLPDKTGKPSRSSPSLPSSQPVSVFTASHVDIIDQQIHRADARGRPLKRKDSSEAGRPCPAGPWGVSAVRDAISRHHFSAPEAYHMMVCTRNGQGTTWEKRLEGAAESSRAVVMGVYVVCPLDAFGALQCLASNAGR